MRIALIAVIATAFAIHGFGQSTSPNSQPTPGANANPTPPGPQRPSPSLPDADTAGRRGAPFLTGKVMMQEGGTAPPDIVEIETLCNGRRSAAAAFTDSKGMFHISTKDTNPIAAATGRSSATSFGGCDVRASLPGFRSSVISLDTVRYLDNPFIGTLILTRLAKVEGFTFSGTSLYAPKAAVKAYEKGRSAARKLKWAEAETQFRVATSLYPTYAVAWYELGLACERADKGDEAKSAFRNALTADAKYVKPYVSLAGMAVKEKKWAEAAEHAGTAIRLNPYSGGDVYLASAAANLNIGRFEVAEKHAREALSIDVGKVPGAYHALALALAKKNDYRGAVENLQGYLRALPNAPNSEQVKAQIRDFEALAARKK